MKYRILTIAAMAIALGACSSAPKSGAAKATDAKAAAPAKAGAKATPAAKAAPKASAGGDVTCSYGEVKRELKIVQSPEKCAVEYTKDGTAQEIGTGQPGSAYCQEIVDRVKNNLTAAGYKCQ